MNLQFLEGDKCPGCHATTVVREGISHDHGVRREPTGRQIRTHVNGKRWEE